jgi:hypothetical protein
MSFENDGHNKRITAVEYSPDGLKLVGAVWVGQFGSGMQQQEKKESAGSLGGCTALCLGNEWSQAITMGMCSFGMQTLASVVKS